MATCFRCVRLQKRQELLHKTWFRKELHRLYRLRNESGQVPKTGFPRSGMRHLRYPTLTRTVNLHKVEVAQTQDRPVNTKINRQSTLLSNIKRNRSRP